MIWRGWTPTAKSKISLTIWMEYYGFKIRSACFWLDHKCLALGKGVSDEEEKLRKAHLQVSLRNGRGPWGSGPVSTLVQYDISEHNAFEFREALKSCTEEFSIFAISSYAPLLGKS